MREAELVQDLAHRALVVGNAEALGDDALQIDAPPAHNTMHGPIRSGLDEAGQLGLLLGGEAGRVAFGPGVFEPVRAALVEAVDPISQGLSMPPRRAASVRLIPSRTAARDKRRRLWLAFLVDAASRRSSPAEKSVRSLTAAGMAQALPTPSNQLQAQRESPTSQRQRPLV